MLDSMSTKERPKKKEDPVKTKDSSSEWLDNMDLKEVKPEIKSDKMQSSVEISKIELLQQQFIEKVPSWVNKPWMFVQPTHQSHLKSWIESWKSVIVDYSEHFNLHVISLTELQGEYPYKNTKINKKLSKSQLNYIVDDMVNTGVAQWLDDNHILVRVYYKTRDQWKEIIVSFLFDKGYAAEVITFFELENMEELWSSLPRDEIKYIFQLLIEEGRAKWADSSKDSFKLIY